MSDDDAEMPNAAGSRWGADRPSMKANEPDSLADDVLAQSRTRAERSAHT
jgi:hypothetical protein